MIATCAMCKWKGQVPDHALRLAPILAFFNPKYGRRKYAPDVWICDDCAMQFKDKALS